MSPHRQVAHLAPGTKLPPLDLFATTGERIVLADLPGRSVVYVYPWTGRPGLPNPPGWDDISGAHGSTPETEGFRDLFSEFGRLGVAVFGLSTQATDYQREMVGRLRVPFPVLSDASLAFARALGLPTFEAGERLTLLIEGGRIARAFHPVPDPAAHASEVLKALTA